MELIVSLLIGALAGYLANHFMDRGKGSILMNLLLGIGGAFLGNIVFGLIGLDASSWVGRLLCATGGAVLLIYIRAGHQEMKNVLVLALALSALACVAQENKNVLVYGLLKHSITTLPVSKGFINVYEDSGSKQKLVMKNDSGYYSLTLDFGHVYHLEFGAKGFMAKKVRIDTRDVPAAAQEGGFGMNIDMRMIKPNRKKNYRFLKDELMGKAAFDKEAVNFTWDVPHTEQMKEKLKLAGVVDNP